MINGMNLAEQYYEEFGRVAWIKSFQIFRCKNRPAFGLVGEGSQCFGFDDEISAIMTLRRDFVSGFPTKTLPQPVPLCKKAYDSPPPPFLQSESAARTSSQMTVWACYDNRRIYSCVSQDARRPLADARPKQRQYGKAYIGRCRQCRRNRRQNHKQLHKTARTSQKAIWTGF